MFKVGDKVRVMDTIPDFLKEEYEGKIITLKKKYDEVWWECEEYEQDWLDSDLKPIGCPNSGIILKEDLCV